jgi:hypothetical protein
MAGKKVRNSLLDDDPPLTNRYEVTIIERTKPEWVEYHNGVYKIFKHDHSKNHNQSAEFAKTGDYRTHSSTKQATELRKS